MELSKIIASYPNSGTGSEPIDVSGADLSSRKEVDSFLEFLAKTQANVVIADGCRITDKGCIKIAEYLRKNERIKVLSMRNNDMGNMGAKTLAKAIKSNKVCTHLNLLGNRNIGSKIVEALCDAYLGNTSMISICGVWPEGLPSSWEVHVDELSPVDAKFISAEIGKGKSDLVSLDLSCHQGDTPDYEAIIRALEFNTKLVSLSCANFKLDGQPESFMDTFREALSSNTSLKTLTLIHSGTSSTYARRAFGDTLKGLQANRGLTTLRLDGFNTLSSEGGDSSLTTALLDTLKGNRSLLHLNLYREDFLNDNRSDYTTDLAPLLAKALGRSKLRLLRITTMASSTEEVSEKKQGTSKAFLSALLSAADEIMEKRKSKPLVVRFNEDEHLSGKPPGGREEVEYLDWEVKDQVNLIKDESNHDDSVPSRIMSVFEMMDGKGEDASSFLHYSVQLLDSSFSFRSDVSPANFVEMFSIDHRSRPYTLSKAPPIAVADAPIASGDRNNSNEEAEVEKGGAGDGHTKKDKKEKKEKKSLKRSKKSRKNKKSEEDIVVEEPTDVKTPNGAVEDGVAKGEPELPSEIVKKASQGPEEKAGNPAPKDKVEAGYIEPKQDKLTGVRFFGDPTYYLAAVLHNNIPGLVDVVLMDGKNKIERVDETMLRNVDQDIHDLPKNADHCDKGFFRRNDIVEVHLESNPEVTEAKLVKVIAKKGVYDLEPIGGGEVITRVLGRFITPKLAKGKKCSVLLGRDGSKAFRSVVEAGIVMEVGESSDEKFDKFAVKLNSSGRIVNVGERQILFYNREGVRNPSLDDFEAYSGLKGETPAVPNASESVPERMAAQKTPKETLGNSSPKKEEVVPQSPSRTPRKDELSADMLRQMAEIEAAKETEAAAFDEIMAINEGDSAPAPEFKSQGSIKAILPQPITPKDESSGAVDSPEYRFGVRMQHTRNKDVGISESKSSGTEKKSKIVEDDDHHHHAVVVLGSSTERITSIKKHAHKPSYQRHFTKPEEITPLGFHIDKFPKPTVIDAIAGVNDIMLSATTRTPLVRRSEFNHSISVGGDKGDFMRPEPPDYPRTFNTAPGRLRQIDEVMPLGSPVNLDEPPNTVGGLYSEIVVMQRALDGEAEVLRKAMSLLDARKNGPTLGNYFPRGQNDTFQGRNDEEQQPMRTSESSRFPPLGRTFDTADILSPVKMPQFMDRYPAPVSQRDMMTASVGNTFASVPPPKITSPALEAQEPKLTLRAQSTPQSARGGLPSESAVNHGILSHGQIAGLVVIAEQKDMKSVRLFVERVFESSSQQTEDILTLLGSNGYDGSERLHGLFSTLAEAAAASSPVAFLRSQLVGDKTLLSGHAQKLISSYADLLIEAESYKRFGL